MRCRWLGSTASAIAFACLLLTPGLVAQSPATKAGAARPSAALRTPDGRPDLQGNWSYATITPLERDRALGDKAVLTDEEARAIEAQAAARANQDDGRQRGTAADVSRAYNDAWYDRGTRVVGTRQTSIIIDPPDGRIPAMTPDGQARAAARAAARRTRGAADGPEDRSLAERCLIGFNAGPPLAPSAYNNNIVIAQTRDYVTIMTEMVHETRIVSLDGRPHLPAGLTPWMGDSRGHWEGDTLVVETTNFSEKNLPRGASPALKLIEKFSRTGPDVLTYEYTMNDPATWTRPWTGRIPLEKLNEEVYEYACHEGNRGMEGILKGARTDERGAANAR
jgi:hypothetical protein